MGKHDARETKVSKVYAPSRAAADAVAGAVSGAVARVVIGPLDVLKIRFQVQLEPISRAVLPGQQISKYTSIWQALLLILKEEGVPASSSTSNQQALQLAIHYPVIPHIQTHAQALALKDEFTRDTHEMRQMNSVQGLWRGTVPGILLTVPYTGVQFVMLQQCKQWANSRGMTSPKWKQSTSFVSGAIAGASATIASYPFDLLRTTLAAQGEPKAWPPLMP